MTQSSTLSALYGALAMALLTLMDAFLKAASGPFDAVQLLWVRFALTALFAALLLKLWRMPWPARKGLPTHLLRAVLMIISNGTFIYALGKLPLAEVFALALTAPVFLTALGAVTLKEQVTANTVVGLALGFCGMLVIAFAGASAGASGGERSVLALIAALTAPVTYAVSLVLLRTQATGEAPVQVTFVQALLVVLITAPALAFSSWQPALQVPHWPTLLAIGLTSAAGYLILVKALSNLTAVRYAVIEYTGLVWAGLIGWLWFAERPTPALVLGAGLIVAGALVSVLQQEAAKAAP